MQETKNFCQFRNLRLVVSLIVALIIASCRTALCKDPTIDRLIGRGDEELTAGHYSSARRFYLSALAYDANNARMLLKVAEAEEKMGNLDQAIRRTRLVTQLEPNSIQAHLQLAQFFEADRDKKAAELQYERIVDLAKSDDQVSAACDKVTSLLIDLGDLERADQLSRAWLRKYGKSADSHFNRAFVLSHSSKAKNLETAAKEYHKCLTLAPDYNRAHYQLGLFYLDLGDTAQAKEELKRFINNRPSQAELEQAQGQLSQLK